MSDQAIRLFEALSDVDEELLERCNRKAERKNAAVHRLLQRYGRTMAAGICLIVAGALSWGGYHLITGYNGADSSGSAQSMDTAGAELSHEAQPMNVANEGTEGYCEEGLMSGNGTEPAGGAAEECEKWDEGVGEAWNPESETGMSRAESDSLSAAVTAASPEAAKQQTMQDIQSQASGDGSAFSGGKTENQAVSELRQQENALADSRREISWEEACGTEPFGSYLPDVLPEGYEPFSARRSTMPDQWDNIIYKWSDGEQIFYLNMTLGEVVTKEELERRDGLYEYLAEEFRRELIPDMLPLEEPVSFVLYYADGMRIEFSGYITADEMWKVAESISAK